MFLSILIKNLILKYQIQLNKRSFIPINKCLILKSLMKTLPCKNKFCSSLSGKEISDKEYQHVLKVQSKFETRIRVSRDLYLKRDVLLLTDAFEIFRHNISRKLWLKLWFQSLFEYTSIKLGCNAYYEQSGARSYFLHLKTSTCIFFLFFL